MSFQRCFSLVAWKLDAFAKASASLACATAVSKSPASPAFFAADSVEAVVVHWLRKSAAYCASKASLSAFFESVRIDLIGSGVDVTIVHPGFIKTPLTAGRKAKMPYIMEVDYAVEKIIHAIEKRKKSYAFPWQLATIVRASMLMPNFMYDWIAARNSFRE